MKIHITIGKNRRNYHRRKLSEAKQQQEQAKAVYDGISSLSQDAENKKKAKKSLDGSNDSVKYWENKSNNS